MSAGALRALADGRGCHSIDFAIGTFTPRTCPGRLQLVPEHEPDEMLGRGGGSLLARHAASLSELRWSSQRRLRASGAWRSARGRVGCGRPSAWSGTWNLPDTTGVRNKHGINGAGWLDPVPPHPDSRSSGTARRAGCSFGSRSGVRGGCTARLRAPPMTLDSKHSVDSNTYLLAERGQFDTEW